MTTAHVPVGSGAKPMRPGAFEQRVLPNPPASPLAFEEILRAHGHDLRAFVGRRVRDPELAGDVVQETLLRAYRARHTFDANRPAWPWLATIARNLILNTQRDEWRRRQFVGDPGSELETQADPRADVDPEESYITGQRRLAIAEALAALTQRQRRVLLLRAADDFTYADIASFEGISIDAVKALLKRARRAFRETYKTYEPEPHGSVTPILLDVTPPDVWPLDSDRRLTPIRAATPARIHVLRVERED